MPRRRRPVCHESSPDPFDWGLLDIRSDAIPPDLFSGFAGDCASVVLGPKTFIVIPRGPRFIFSSRA